MRSLLRMRYYYYSCCCFLFYIDFCFWCILLLGTNNEVAGAPHNLRLRPFEAGNEKQELWLRGSFKSFEGGFSNSASAQHASRALGWSFGGWRVRFSAILISRGLVFSMKNNGKHGVSVLGHREFIYWDDVYLGLRASFARVTRGEPSVAEQNNTAEWLFFVFASLARAIPFSFCWILMVFLLQGRLSWNKLWYMMETRDILCFLTIIFIIFFKKIIIEI